MHIIKRRRVIDMIYQREKQIETGVGKPKAMLYLDTMDDFVDLPGLDKVAPGSDAYCVATQDVYILNSLGEWVVQ